MENPEILIQYDVLTRSTEINIEAHSSQNVTTNMDIKSSHLQHIKRNQLLSKEWWPKVQFLEAFDY